MRLEILTALGPLGLAELIGQADPAAELIRSGYAQLGFLALLLGLGWWVIRQEQKRTVAIEALWKERLAEADARTAAERTRANEREADSLAVRDVFIKDVVPTMTMQAARFEHLLEGMERVVVLIERVMNSALEKPK